MMVPAPSKSPLPESTRVAQIDKVCAGFVAPGKSNRDIYRALLECVLPSGAGIPGPIVTADDMRNAVHAIKPGYKDVFRRVRELQGEEGVTGLIKIGSKYQLIHLAVGAKREPRKAISATKAREIALEQGSRCTVCGEPIEIEGERIEVDHRVPRRRGGTSHKTNLQVLCRQCNNRKSTQCSNCSLNCHTCGWAFPEQYRPIKLRPDIVLRLNTLARETNQVVDDMTSKMVDRVLRDHEQGKYGLL
ncbi:MAG: HNH endonuclease [Gammaproteobacteria bacterium]|nr:HNH endonuclease [Terriglobia bacterium]MYF30254.1 HNH endonuclease [Gammaproteobacteria bacterium]